jgi:hypothetical protein
MCIQVYILTYIHTCVHTQIRHSRHSVTASQSHWQETHTEALMFILNYSKFLSEVAPKICGTNGGEDERVWVIGRKARTKVTTRKTEM